MIRSEKVEGVDFPCQMDCSSATFLISGLTHVYPIESFVASCW